MNQLVAFFAPTALPNAAGAAVRAQNGAQVGDFANILAQFQSAIAGDPVQPIDPVTQQILDQLPPGLLQAAANLSTDQIAAQLQTLTGAPAGENPPQINALLALLNPSTATNHPNADQPPAHDTNADTSLAAMLAALQLPTQSATQQPTQTTTAAAPAAAPPAATPSEIGLRGSIAATEQTQPPQTAQPETAANAKAAENAAAALLAPAAHPRPKNESQQPQPQQPQPAKALVDGAKGDNQVPPTAAATAQTSNTPTTDKPAETPAPANGSAQNSTTSHSPASTAATAQPTADAAPQPATSSHAATPTGISATPSPVLPTLIGAQQMSVTVSAAPQTAVPLGALAVQIARKFEAGISQFEISLHPAELGQLDISLSVADDGHVQAILRAERPETLELLQRDARSLEQQLRQAGLEVGSNALSFSLSGNGQQRHAPFAGWPAFAQAQDAADVAKQDAAKAYIAVRNPDGVDIRV